MNSNKIVLDLNKVQFAFYYWVNQYGNYMYHEPNDNSIYVQGTFVNGHEIAAYHPSYPGETMLERAKRLDIIDAWVPTCLMQLTANHSVIFTGKKATTMWKMWCAKIIKRKKE